MKKHLSLILSLLLSLITLFSVGCSNDDSVIIFTSTEDFMVDLLEEKLDEEFPDMDIKIEYMSTSNIAAKVLIEKESSECDIVFAQEYAYLEQLAEADALSDLDGLYDFSVFTSDAVASEYSSYIIPTEKTGGGIIINNKVLEDRGIDKPTSYQDLLEPEFKGLISMPNPKSSSTGYMFYLSLVNEWGEEKALELQGL